MTSRDAWNAVDGAIKAVSDDGEYETLFRRTFGHGNCENWVRTLFRGLARF